MVVCRPEPMTRVQQGTSLYTSANNNLYRGGQVSTIGSAFKCGAKGTALKAAT
jgi:hypothetical protein